jgi:NADH:ubiquinone reductase (H+-translocating)
VVIVGAGFGGLAAARALRNAPAEVLVVDRKNHHLFQPLLYQVATAGLAATQIASPVRSILASQEDAHVVLGEVTGVDLAARQVTLSDRKVAYDQLVIATGSTHSYFGHGEWAEFAPGLKTLDDALEVRRRILTAFERAEVEEDRAERERLMTFVVIGGGPTGVELAGAIAELARRALTRDFRAIRSAMAKVVLVEADARVLPTFPPALSAYARRALERLGVTVNLGEPVRNCDARGVGIGSRRIEAGVVLWAAGVQASSAARWLGVESDRAGRVIVGPNLTIPGHEEAFVIGDTASIASGALPGLAPVAKQQGAYVGQVIRDRLAARRATQPFRYRDAGALATIGRHAAVVAMGPVRLVGAPAWFFWSAAHIFLLIGFRNRLAVSLEWAWSYLTFERGARLIVGAATARNRS